MNDPRRRKSHHRHEVIHGKLFLDKEANQVKVIIPDPSRPEAEEILKRHEPNDTWSQPYEE